MGRSINIFSSYYNSITIVTLWTSCFVVVPYCLYKGYKPEKLMLVRAEIYNLHSLINNQQQRPLRRIIWIGRSFVILFTSTLLDDGERVLDSIHFISSKLSLWLCFPVMMWFISWNTDLFVYLDISYINPRNEVNDFPIVKKSSS